VVALRRERGAHGERNGDGTRVDMLALMTVVGSRRRLAGGVAHPRPQIMQRLQNVGVAREKAGDQNSHEQDDKGQEEYECKHDVSFDSEEPRRLYRGARERRGLFEGFAREDRERSITERRLRMRRRPQAIR
jgi:hypothetical protein